MNIVKFIYYLFWGIDDINSFFSVYFLDFWKIIVVFDKRCMFFMLFLFIIKLKGYINMYY